MIRNLFLITFVFLLVLSVFASATNFDSTDLFTEDGSSGTDAKTFVDRTLTMEIDSPDIMVACFDFDKTCGDSPTYTECFAANDDDFNACEAYHSWLTGMGHTTDSSPELQSIPVTSAKTTCVDARYYKNCDGLGNGNLYGVDEKRYWIFDRKKYDCDSGNPSWYTYDAEGYINPGNYDYKDEISCGAYKKCSEDDDDVYVYSSDGIIPDPCRTEDGTTYNHACSSSSQCWSNYCGGAKLEEKYKCSYDGSSKKKYYTMQYYSSCGGQGYSNIWINHYDLDCDSGYVCDSDHDEVVVVYPPNPPDPCRKDIGESCSSSSDCWNDDGGNICSSINKCTDKANGRDCGTDSDCNGYCCNGVCSGSTCGGSQNYCSGKINVVTSTSDLNVYIDSLYEATTDNSYFYQKSITDATCATSYDVVVKCPNNLTTCYTETTYLNSEGETATVVDSDCVKTCSEDENIWITNKDVVIKNNIINLSYHSADFSGSVDIKLQKISRSTGLIDGEYTISSSIATKSTKNEIYSGFDLSDASGLNIYLEASDDDKNDNYVYRVISKDTPKAYLSINTLYPEVDSLIRTYLEQYVDPVDQNEAELIISVGKFTDEFEEGNKLTLLGGMSTYIPNWGKLPNENKIWAYGKKESAKYSGIVGRTYYNNKPLVLAYGNYVEGDIAAVKKLISSRGYFFSDYSTIDKAPILMDKYDILALGINNILPKMVINSSGYLKAVNNILFDNIYDIAIRTVKTTDQTSYGQETILRLKNVNSDYSKDFKDAISDNDKPVVFSGGIFSNLESWENKGKGLARELANEGRDVWEIEMNGGPQIENDDCCNYTYQDQVDYYWPALIAGVQAYTSKNSVDYVGHSNGGRVALSSLNSYSNGKPDAGYYFNYTTGLYSLTYLESNPVDIYVGVAVPAVLNSDSSLTQANRVETSFGEKVGHFSMSTIESPHIKMSDYALRASSTLLFEKQLSLGVTLLTINSIFTEPNKISRNLLEYYINLSIDETSTLDVSNVDVNKVILFNGKPSDFIVPFQDQAAIYNDLSVQDKSIENRDTGLFPIPFVNDHSALTKSSKLKKIVEEELK